MANFCCYCGNEISYTGGCNCNLANRTATFINPQVPYYNESFEKSKKALEEGVQFIDELKENPKKITYEETTENLIEHVKSLGISPEKFHEQVMGISSLIRGPVSIKEWQKKIHSLAKEKGWYDTERSNTELLALAICELSEAIEEERKGTDTYYEVEGKPCGIQVEIGDCIIRLLDMCESRGWNIEEVMQKKHKYNKTRSYKHGGKKL